MNHPNTALLVAPKEAEKLLNIGHTTLYTLIRQKKLVVVKIGRATRVTVASIRAFAAGEGAQ